MKVVTDEEMRELERRCEERGVTTDLLMEKAGLAVAEKARQLLGDIRGKAVAVLVGPGNNGGDGLVAARHLHQWGARVSLFLCAPRKEEDSNYQKVRELGVDIIELRQGDGMRRLEGALRGGHLVIDAVLGTGKLRPLEGVMKEALGLVEASRGLLSRPTVLALDMPSGLGASTGAVDPATPTADVTVSLGYPKVGHFMEPGLEKVGRLEVVDIGIPSGLDADIKLELLTSQWARAVLPPRPRGANKGTFGRVMVVAGSMNFIGAAYLACMGAYRVGAGLVTLAMAESLVPVMASKMTEATFFPLLEGDTGLPHGGASGSLRRQLPNYDVLLAGCGLGQAALMVSFIKDLLLNHPLPDNIKVVLDADALNILSRVEGWWYRYKLPGWTVITPHPGEMARLVGVSIEEVQGRRLQVARETAGRWQKVVVLKGACTVIASPDGRARLSPFANPALASGGTGDVLSGAIAGLLAQGLEPFEAACLGVYLHGLAGERVVEEMGDAGVVAGDLLPVLPRVIKGIKDTRDSSRDEA